MNPLLGWFLCTTWDSLPFPSTQNRPTSKGWLVETSLTESFFEFSLTRIPPYSLGHSFQLCTNELWLEVLAPAAFLLASVHLALSLKLARPQSDLVCSLLTLSLSLLLIAVATYVCCFFSFNVGAEGWVHPTPHFIAQYHYWTLPGSSLILFTLSPHLAPVLFRLIDFHVFFMDGFAKQVRLF